MEYRVAISHLGGGVGALDNIDGSDLSDGHKAVVVESSGQVWWYNLDTDSGLDEDGTNFSVISPDANAGTKRWILVGKTGRVLIPDDTVDQGDNSIVGTLAWHIADASSNPTTITILPGTHTLSTNTTIPITMVLKPQNGAILQDDTDNATLTVTGTIEAGDYQIFDFTNGTGAVSFGNNNRTIVNPYWWFSGTKNSGDEYAAFTAAITSLGNGCAFVVPAGEHYVSDTVEFKAKYRLTIYWHGRLAPYDTFDDFLVYFGIGTGAGNTADPEIADLGMNLNVIGHIRLNCLNDSETTLQQARGAQFYGVYLSKFAPITVLGPSGHAIDMDNMYENYFEAIFVQGAKLRYAFDAPDAWDSGTEYTADDYVYRDYDAYAGGTTYSINDHVTYDSKAWRSLADSNTGNTPASGSAYWQQVPYDYFKSVRTGTNKDPHGSTNTNQAVEGDQYWQRVYRDEALIDLVQSRRYGVIDQQIFGYIDVRHFDNLCVMRVDHAPGYEDSTAPSNPTGTVALIRVLSGQIHAMNSAFDTAWGSARSMTYPQDNGNLVELGRVRRISFNSFHFRPGFMTNTNAIELSGLNPALLTYNVSLNDCEITDGGTNNVGISVRTYYYGETEPGKFDVTFNGMAGTNPRKYVDPSYQVFSAKGQSQHLWMDQTATIRGELGNSDGAWSLGADRGSESLRVIPTSSAVNYLVARGAVTTAEPSLEAGGSDTDIDVTIIPKGAGNVKFGTHSAIVAETVTGYITIKDAAGNSRKIAVVS